MNESLELQNNQIIFSRAIQLAQKILGEVTKDKISDFRKIFLKSSWKIEARRLKEMRECIGMSIQDVSVAADLRLSDLRKIETAKDFDNRDATVQFLQNFYQSRLN